MLPFIVIGSLRIPTYGLMMAIAFIVAAVIAETEFRRKGLGRNNGWDTAITALIAGVIGARINFLIEHPGLPLRDLLSGSGLTWYGGFILGLVTVLVFWRIRKVRLLPAMDTMAPALCLAYAIGRIGCQLSGDGDYGKPSGLPWAMSFPNGTVPTLDRVHPTPVYEVIVMSALFLLLWSLRRRRLPAGSVFWLYLIGYGIERFLIEFLRTNRPVAWFLTEAQVASVVMIFAGVLLIIRSRRISGGEAMNRARPARG